MPNVEEQLRAAVSAFLDERGYGQPPAGITLERPRQREHGDWSTNVALQVAKQAGKPPRALAEELADGIRGVPHLDHTEVAGPGFVNFHLQPTWLHDVLEEVIAAGDTYGRGDELTGQRINLEFVSANPTGPLHAGGGRWAAYGDALGNLLAAQGATVHREYLLNDAGHQLDAFGRSLLARLHGEEPPEDGYHGAYVTEMAERLGKELGDDPTLEDAREWGYREIVGEVRADLERIGVRFDTWFSERTLHERGDVEAAVERLRANRAVAERDGAVWFLATEHGDQRDRVLVKSDGSPTYLAADVAYHLDKLTRGWDHLIDVWGADHHGQVASLQGALAALGIEGPQPQPEVILGQLVALMKDGAPVRLSKRTGDIITLADVLDEVDADACRLTFLLQSIDTALTFDIDVVTAQSMENPVYYVQYAHARIASIGRLAAERQVERAPLHDADLSLLTHERELDLLRSLATYPETLADAARGRAPHRVTTWVRELAGRFHGFYHDCRVLPGESGVTPELTQARLWLVEACRVALADALAVLGVHAPEAMERLEAE